jgi:hypothetical protein
MAHFNPFVRVVPMPLNRVICTIGEEAIDEIV